MLSRTNLQIALKLLLILISAVWVSLWLLKPTKLWTKSWHKAEDNARETVFGYYGLNFVVYSLPVISMAITGYLYLYLYAKKPRGLRRSRWQFRLMKIGTRLGLLAEVCLALLLLPVLRGMSLFRLFRIQFEASVGYHICLGTAMILFATLHGAAPFSFGVLNSKFKMRISNLDHITSSNKTQVVRDFLLHAPFLCCLPSTVLVSYWRSALLHGFLGGSPIWPRQAPSNYTIKTPNGCSISPHIPVQSYRTQSIQRPKIQVESHKFNILKVPSISKFQWHPFSITSSSSVDDERITVIVKSDGWWTSSLYDTMVAAVDSDPYEVKCLPVHIEGPYGPVCTDFLRYAYFFILDVESRS
ncbi:hypothetical protein C5167_041811 [Papaver somniferum]|nr:hypothetical protein C5167_041811 [Papaver somniferum]